MIKCIIDNKVAYPKAGQTIKVTRENPYVSSSDSYTYDVTFPMDIFENRIVFRNISRQEVAKRTLTFDSCILMADNRTVIRGKGTVMAITQDEVRLQILAGMSAVKFGLKAQQIFIDRLTYPLAGPVIHYDKQTAWAWFDYQDLNQLCTTGNPVVGIEGRAVYMPMWDTSKDRPVNWMAFFAYGVSVQRGFKMDFPAVQPNLMLVLRTVLQEMGYTTVTNDYDREPWNRLYIANAKCTNKIANALPHWKAETLLDEFRKLFNASFLFDDATKSVHVIRNNELSAGNVATYEPLDEYSTEYDEDGLEYLGTSNLAYAIESSEDRRFDVIPDEVLKNYEIVDMGRADVAQQTDEFQFTHIFRQRTGYFYVREDEKDGQTIRSMDDFGQFTKLVRDLSSDNTVELRMVPVGMNWQEFDDDHRCLLFKGISDLEHAYVFKGRLFLPFTDSGDPIVPGEESGDDEIDYVSVQNALEGTNPEKEKEEDDTKMELFFLAKEFEHVTDTEEYGYPGFHSYFPRTLTDYRIHGAALFANRNKISMALQMADGLTYVGQLHEGGVRGNGDQIRKNFQLVFSFITDDIPDPKKIYLFRGKKYLCAKIEMTVDDDGISRLKLGYFYELL